MVRQRPRDVVRENCLGGGDPPEESLTPIKRTAARNRESSTRSWRPHGESRGLRVLHLCAILGLWELDGFVQPYGD